MRLLPRFLGRLFFAVAATSLFVSPSAAGEFDYDFDGTLSDVFDPLFGIPEQVLVQQNGRLEFHNNNISAPTDDGRGVVHRTFQPRYDESWTASVEATIPLSYNQFDGDPPASNDEQLDEYLTVGIAAAFFAGSIDDDASQFLVPLLEVSRFFPQTAATRELSIDSGGGVLQRVETPVGTATIKLSFDATTKTFSVFQDDFLLTTVDIDDPTGVDWGMSDTDVFEVILLGDSFNEPIDPANPLTLDNFRAAIVIPEPASVALLLLAVLGSVKQRP